jgi:hypothetical protein
MYSGTGMKTDFSELWKCNVARKTLESASSYIEYSNLLMEQLTEAV